MAPSEAKSASDNSVRIASMVRILAQELRRHVDAASKGKSSTYNELRVLTDYQICNMLVAKLQCTESYSPYAISSAKSTTSPTKVTSFSRVD